MVMRISEELLAAVYDGLCTVYASKAEPGDFDWASKRVRREMYREIPCHLAFEQTPATGSGTVGEVKAGCVLFLGAQYEIAPGSEVVVKQNDREYKLALSGLPRVYALHQEIKAALLAELA